MEYARIPTALLTDRIPERDIIAIVKFQLLWAHREQEPNYEIARRWLTDNQIKRAQGYIESISTMILPDIASLTKKRNRDKKLYYKTKASKENPTDETSIGASDGKTVGPTTHIIEKENKTTDKNNINETKKDVMKGGMGENEGLGHGFNGFKGIPLPPFPKLS